jgi:hypothetical protein
MGTGVDEPSIHAPACFLVPLANPAHVNDCNQLAVVVLRLEEALAPLETARSPGRFGIGIGVALVLHVLALWVLAHSISFQFVVEKPVEPKIVALAPQLMPPPPDVEKLGSVDAIQTLPRFRPRVPAVVPQRQRMMGDPALAIWTYLCNRDTSLTEATNVFCPTDFSIDLGLNDPLNRRGDVGALFGPDTTTMSLDEAAAKKGWAKPKSGWQGNGARAKGSDLGLPGHDPFAILPEKKSKIWGGQP